MQSILAEFKALPASASEQRKDAIRKRFCAVGGELVGFYKFVQALGTRYSGHYKPPGSTTALPRVSYWSVWNEPNQPGWLSPQWRSSRSGPAMEGPVLYRAYANAAFRALDSRRSLPEPRGNARCFPVRLHHAPVRRPCLSKYHRHSSEA